MTAGSFEEENAGLLRNLRFFIASFIDYFQARLELAGLESKSALFVYLQIFLWIGSAILFLIFSYFFFCLSIVFLIYHLLKIDWMWIVLGMAILHVLLAAGGLFAAWQLFKRPVFQTTLAEFKKDREWLRTLKTQQSPH